MQDEAAGKPPKTAKSAKLAKPTRGRTKNGNPLRAIGGYFKGAWQELKAVRWPNRRSTWGLTLAVLGFTAFFIVLILIVDAGFSYLFREVILK